MIWALALVLLPEISEPQIALVDLQLQGKYKAALHLVEGELAKTPEPGEPLGLDYLRGHLLTRLKRPQEAHEAFAKSITATPDLAAYGFYRLALIELELNHPEVAAGLFATLLGRGPPASLVAPSSKLLVRSIRNGGDCRLLRASANWDLPQPEMRSIQLMQAQCALKIGQATQATKLLLDLIRASDSDETARAAAAQIAQLVQPGAAEGSISRLLGITFHRHREFSQSILFLDRSLQLQQEQATGAAFEEGYAQARNLFWRARYQEAEANFTQLAGLTKTSEDRARTLYQRARSIEMKGDWRRAAAAYDAVAELDSISDWTPAGLFASLRLLWRSGHEEEAYNRYKTLISNRRWRGLGGRAALFLLSSDLVRGRTDRVSEWFLHLRQLGGVEPVEISYWKGRLEELEGRYPQAVQRYVGSVRSNPFHPLAQLALKRLASNPLAEATQQYALQAARSQRSEDLYSAWLMLGDDHPVGSQARALLESKLKTDAQSQRYLELRTVSTRDWPLWSATLNTAEEHLLALGIWQEGAPKLLKYFPMSDTSLAYTGSQLLASSGLINRSLYVAEILADRMPKRLPPQFVPIEFRRLLFPSAYDTIISEETKKRGLDPLLLAAIIREESRFDPDAISAASARGLAQFVLPTARRHPRDLGLNNN
jgi:tetratricopeptide (TPR) repeat protein